MTHDSNVDEARQLDEARQFIECEDGRCGIRNRRRLMLDRIVQIEWDFFQNVNNVGGRANCQDMPKTFWLMREANFSVWSEEMLTSYYEDLRVAQKEARNPLTEKYGYMMAYTHPDEFERIKDALPSVTSEKRDLVTAIVAIQLAWAEDIAHRYPHFAARGRSIHSTEDSQQGTSMETYAKGELFTYSCATLQLVLARFEQAQNNGENLQETIDTHIARGYGYTSLAQIESDLARDAS